ncbi:hypothetical protein XELAEV_18041995mg [Xenopus laevis]|uniref:Uncharacterized protein n=1 Tax=Xenopus laevis TaxID=8355 RepID=A0A974C392_XENLA|nr:hypothetical protein XELAEV_18041995mg [Xenopus laevis]
MANNPSTVYLIVCFFCPLQTMAGLWGCRLLPLLYKPCAADRERSAQAVPVAAAGDKWDSVLELEVVM